MIRDAGERKNLEEADSAAQVIGDGTIVDD